MKRIGLIILVVLIMVGCASFPEEYNREPDPSEKVYMETSYILGIAMGIVSASVTYHYLNNKAQYF